MVKTKYFSRIIGYSTSHTSDAAYIIGGSYTQNVVAQYKDGQWRQCENLYRGRRYSGAITIGVQTMIIGGYDWLNSSNLPTEMWALDNGFYNIIQPNLPNYHYAPPALFEVDANFCKKVTSKS